MSFDAHYELLDDQLGSGAFSVVLKARSRSTDEIVAVKCIDKKGLRRDEVTDLEREALLLGALDHPHLLKLYGFYQDDKRYYLATEILKGGELFDRIIEKEFYSEGDARTIVKTLGGALQYLHAQGIVHRDLKPENILLQSKDDDAAIKLADFGFAKKMESSLTTSLGTPGYVAPEILNKQEYGASVDMWALGVIIYILLCGYPPFYDENQSVLFKKIRAGTFQFDSPYWDGVSDAAKDVISKLLVVDPKHRISIEEFLELPWVAQESDEDEKDITPALGELRKFVAKRRLKVGIHGVMALTRMKLTAAAK